MAKLVTRILYIYMVLFIDQYQNKQLLLILFSVKVCTLTVKQHRFWQLALQRSAEA